MVPSSFITSQMTPAGGEPRQPRQVHRALGLAGAHQHPALAGAQREDVAGPGQVLRPAFVAHRGEDGVGPVAWR